jgi:hypothetical protein
MHVSKSNAHTFVPMYDLNGTCMSRMRYIPNRFAVLLAALNTALVLYHKTVSIRLSIHII